MYYTLCFFANAYLGLIFFASFTLVIGYQAGIHHEFLYQHIKSAQII